MWVRSNKLILLILLLFLVPSVTALCNHVLYVEDDIIDCIVGLGKDLFYNSSMESCLVFGRTKKDSSKKGKILFIDAKDEITRKKTQSFLEPQHIKKIHDAYKN
jgi:type I restriction enzyme M protein